MLEAITENLDVWTIAQKPKKTVGRGGSKKDEAYGIKKLRELILELAVRGKLVPQDSSDEPATVLLEKIAEEKQRLIDEGVIKRQKALPDIDDAAKTQHLPSGWEWVKLGTIIDFVNGFAFKSNTFQDSGVGIIKIGDIQNGQISTTSMSRVNREITENLDKSLEAKKGDMLIAMSGATTGKLGINTTDEVFYINQRVGKISPYVLSKEFLYFPLTTKIEENLAKSLGSAIPNLSTVQIKNIVIGLPPLAEQNRIVDKVDELMALCDQLEQEQADQQATHQTLVDILLNGLIESAKTDTNNQQSTADYFNQLIAEQFDTLFTTEQSIDLLKQTILQLAVMGKLIPQDPNDEPASVLLEKVAEEKVRLIEEGKIKKQKPLTEIGEEEKPFELPDGWEWSRIGDASISTDYGLSDKAFADLNGIPVLAMGNIQSGRVLLNPPKSVPETVESLPYLYLENRDLLYNRTNSPELVGKTGVFVGNDNEFTFASYLIRIRTNKESLLPEFINLNMLSPSFRKTQIVPHLKQQCGQANVNGTIMKNMLITVPPKYELHRIVKKVDELMVLCDSLKARLKEAQTIQTRLADSVVKQAVN